MTRSFQGPDAKGRSVQWDVNVRGPSGGDEGVAEAVGGDGFDDPGGVAEAGDDACGVVSIEPATLHVKLTSCALSAVVPFAALLAEVPYACSVGAILAGPGHDRHVDVKRLLGPLAVATDPGDDR